MRILTLFLLVATIHVGAAEPVLEPPTLHCLGVYWITRGDGAIAVEYRKAGDAQWQRGYPLFRVEGGAHVTEKYGTNLVVRRCRIRQCNYGFTARPVVGGVFMQMLYDKAVWQKWAGREKTHAANWAPMPQAPKLTTVIPTAQTQAATWRYTTKAPGKDWFKPAFNDTDWKQGPSGFGTEQTPGRRCARNGTRPTSGCDARSSCPQEGPTT